MVLAAVVLGAVVISDVVLEAMVLEAVVLSALVLEAVVLTAVVLTSEVLTAVVLAAMALLSPSSRPRQAMATRAAACSAYRLFFSQDPELNKERPFNFFCKEKVKKEKRTLKIR